MTTAEARRLDLYNALTDILGTERADTLMTHLPSQSGADLATSSDLQSRFDHLSSRIEGLEQNVTSRFDHFDQRLDRLNQRLDRIVLTLAAGLVAILAAVIAQGLA